MPVQRKSIKQALKKKYMKRRNPYRNYYANRKFTTKPYTHDQQVVTIPGKQVLPFQLRTQFKFTFRASFSYTASTLSTGVANLKANSLTDPMGTSGTAQPPMFDQLMVFYRRYCVLGCSIKIHITPRDAIPIMFYCVPVVDTSASYTLDTANNMPGMKKVLISPDNASGTTTLQNYMRTETITGLRIGDDTLYGSSTNDPTKTWSWHCTFAPMQLSYPSDFVVDTMIELTMYTLLCDTQLVGNS